MMAFPFTWGNALSLIFLGYISNAMYSMYKIYNPQECTDNSRQCLRPAWRYPDDLKQQFVLVISTEGKSSQILRGKYQVLMNDENFDLMRSDSVKFGEISLPISVRRNGSFYLHAFLPSRLPQSDPAKLEDLVGNEAIPRHSIELSRHTVPRPQTISLVSSGKESEKEKTSYTLPYTHLPLTVTIGILSTPQPVSLTELFPKILEMLQLTSDRKYKPLVFINRAAILVKDLVLITPKTSRHELEVQFDQITIGKLKFLTVVDEALNSLTQFGITEQDADSVKGLFFDTSLIILLTTVLVSSLHMLFDVMAIKNDVSFWRTIDNFEGISVRTIGWKCISQLIILLYLYDNDTSRLVLISSFMATVIEVWKLGKALKVSIRWKLFIPVGFTFGSVTEAEKRTDQFDVEGMKYLSYLLWPLCFCGAIYSLYYQPHKSWYSWSVASLANGVYGFGFILMLPQLFLNYKLKSVAHLPWKVFMYKAFNTFIDDLFAFVIYMPTAHRVACFRDDAVFLVFLYQRWLYPVDKSRRNEFGETFEDGPKKSSQGTTRAAARKNADNQKAKKEN